MITKSTKPTPTCLKSRDSDFYLNRMNVAYTNKLITHKKFFNILKESDPNVLFGDNINNIINLSRGECNSLIEKIQLKLGKSIENVLEIKTVWLFSRHSGQNANQKLIALHQFLFTIRSEIKNDNILSLTHQTKTDNPIRMSVNQNDDRSVNTSIVIEHAQNQIKVNMPQAEELYNHYQMRLKNPPSEHLNSHYAVSPLISPANFDIAALLLEKNVTSEQNKAINTINNAIQQQYKQELVLPYSITRNNKLKRYYALCLYGKELNAHFHQDDFYKTQDFSNLFQFLSINAGDPTEENIILFEKYIKAVIRYCAGHPNAQGQYNALNFLKHLTTLMVTGEFINQAVFLHYMSVIAECGIIVISNNYPGSLI